MPEEPKFPFIWKCSHAKCGREREVTGYGWLENVDCPVKGIENCYILFKPDTKPVIDERGIEQPAQAPEETDTQLNLI